MSFLALYWILGIIVVPGIILAIWAQAKVNTTYARTRQKQPEFNNKTADVVAREILDANGLSNITITNIEGELTDHYDPQKQIIALSEGVYQKNTIASLSIATHEVGHAIQDKAGEISSRLRKILVPIINFSDKILWPLVIIGLIFNLFAGWNSIVGSVFMWGGIAFFGLSCLFSLVTLPTELDASRRALKALKDGGYLTTEQDIKEAKSMLTAAALTYVASLIISILNVARFILTILILRDR